MNVVQFAYQVIEMQDRIDALEHEVTRLSKIEHQYNELLDSSVTHGEQMMGGWLKLLLSDRVKIDSRPEGIPFG